MIHPKNQPDKHLAYYALLDGLRAGGCPICRRVSDGVRRLMRAFLYESVNDPEIRARMRRSGGMCHLHMWKLASFGDALGGTILLNDWFASATAAIFEGPRALRHAWPTERRHLKNCYFCQQAMSIENSVMAELSEHLADGAVEKCWDGAPILCITHVLGVERICRDKQCLNRLYAVHQRKYAALAADLAKSVERQDYAHRAAGEQPDESVWLRAAALLVGPQDTGVLP